MCKSLGTKCSAGKIPGQELVAGDHYRWSRKNKKKTRVFYRQRGRESKEGFWLKYSVNISVQGVYKTIRGYTLFRSYSPPSDKKKCWAMFIMQELMLLICAHRWWRCTYLSNWACSLWSQRVPYNNGSMLWSICHVHSCILLVLKGMVIIKKKNCWWHSLGLCKHILLLTEASTMACAMLTKFSCWWDVGFLHQGKTTSIK